MDRVIYRFLKAGLQTGRAERDIEEVIERFQFVQDFEGAVNLCWASSINWQHHLFPGFKQVKAAEYSPKTLLLCILFRS